MKGLNQSQQRTLFEESVFYNKKGIHKSVPSLFYNWLNNLILLSSQFLKKIDLWLYVSIISYEIAMQRKIMLKWAINDHLFIFVNCLKMCIFSMGVCNLHFRVNVLSSYVYHRPYFINYL